MFERPALLWLLALAPLVALPGLMAIARGSRLAGAVAAALRLACFAVLVAMLAGLRVSATIAARRVEVVAVLDHSRSIAPDSREWMDRRVRALESALAPRDRLAVIEFGRDARLAAPPSDPRLVRRRPVSIDSGGTDIAGALDAASSLFPSGADKRVLLLSDGNQTEGSAAREIAPMLADGIRVFTAAVPPSRNARIALTDFAAPGEVRARQRFVLRLAIENGSRDPVDAQVRLLSDGAPIGAERIHLQSGLNRFELPYRIATAGAYLLTAELRTNAPAEVTAPRAEAAVTVTPPPRVLVASASRPESLMSALALRSYRVDLIAPRSLPARASGYLQYQAVILDDVSADALSASAQHALNRYVADFGGGLIVTGDTLRDAKLRGGDLEKTLPVRFEHQPPPPSREPIAVYLCIDRSNSMSYDSRYPAVRDGQRIRYAKQAAIALLRQLDDTDYAGVVAFDSQPYVLGHLEPLGEDRTALEARIERLQPGGGTDFKEALEIAEREILRSAIPVRQVILLTDGDTNRQYHDHDQLIAGMAREHIPVSTIRIGPDLENLRLLQDFAQATGGTFYRVQDIEKLPLLLVGLTRQALNRRTHGRTVVEAGPPSEILSGIDAAGVPPIDFIASTIAKDGAQVPLRIARGARSTPLLAAWQYGLGRSAIFAADPDSLATLSWIRWNRYAEFWSQLVTWTMRQGDPGSYTMKMAAGPDGSVAITAEPADSAPLTDLVCRITGPNRAIDVALTPAGAGLYRGEVGPLARGKYAATLMLKAGDTERILTQRPFASVGAMAPDGEELRIRPPNVQLLRHLAAATHGAYDAPMAEVARHTGAMITVRRSARGGLLPLAIALFLGEVFVRRRFLGD